jgi:hypothetical protein
MRKDIPGLHLLNEMANDVDFLKQKEKQRISHIDKSDNEYTVDFIRDGRGMFYGFSGFGDLIGYYVLAMSTKYQLAENRIGINGEVALYLSNPSEKNIFIHIDSTLGPSKSY